ncbi:class III lanthipeptide [Xanthomonas campestris pv. phormiicola]|nr:class III lanthipeptide [Xanthomonas campestris pv. phormiicola]UYC18415.1 class III lanthipeptide [Xanthomonas campestris pv. phormiicola]
MNRVLNLQRLALDETNSLLGSSTGSSTSNCCNGVIA